MLLNFIHWDINPEIFRIGSFAVRYYSLLFVSGLILGFLMTKKIYEIENIPLQQLDKFATYIVLGTVIGARFGHCLFYQPDYYLKFPLEIILPFHGTPGKDFVFTGYQGLASHGGALGIFLAVYLFSRKYKRAILWLFDRLAIVAALAGFFIRLGNFMNSEIIGSPTLVPWAVIFERIDNIPRHPAQLYEAFAYLIIFGLLAFLYLKKKAELPKGILFGLFLVTVFSMRFLIEFLKENQEGFEKDMLLNMGQILSIPFIILGIFLLIKVRLNKVAQEKQNESI